MRSFLAHPLDCEGVLCAIPECDGVQPVIPTGECCPICPPVLRDCPKICPIPLCRYFFTPPGKCCPQCGVDCSTVECRCGRLDGFADVPEQCCQPRCGTPICGTNEVAVVPEGQCCPVCQLDCTKTICNTLFTCGPLEEPVIPEGECCERCVSICSGVICPSLHDCPHEFIFTPKGECCPKCLMLELDCSKVLCAIEDCRPSEDAGVALSAGHSNYMTHELHYVIIKVEWICTKLACYH